MAYLGERRGLAWPVKAFRGVVRAEPLVPLMLRADGHDARFGDECGEDDGELHGVRAVQIEGLYGDIVQPLDRETRLFPHLAHGRVLGLFTRLHAAVHALPRAGTACIERTLQG